MITPRRILVAGWIVFLLYAYPGFVMTEAADTVVDSRYGAYTDWHSVLMTFVWRRVELVVAGPPGMLFLQSLLLLVGAYSILRRLVTDRAAAIAAVALLLVPPLLATNALICAEAQLASWLVAGTAMLVSDRLRIRLGGLAMMVVACGMREGASWAALPIILSTFTWRTEQPRWRRIAISAAAWIAVVLATNAIERLLVDEPSEREQTRLAMVDIVGTLKYAPTVSDGEIAPLLDGVSLAHRDDLQNRACAVYGKELFYAATDQRVFEPADTAAQRDALYAARRSFIRAMPRAYLVHRWHQLYRELGFSSAPWTTVYTDFTESPRDAQAMSYDGHHSALQRALEKPVELLGNTFVFVPVVYFALAIMLLGYAIWRRHRVVILMLASGFTYELSLFFLSTRVEYRDSHWLITATLLSAFALIALRARPRTAE